MIMHAHPASQRAARFAPGDIVFHKRYHYRGVVVDLDPRCTASDAWYAKNKTQPDRDQPWYHVLVHGSSHATYVAEENLRREPEGRPVAHPLISHFFHAYTDGRYLRNNEPWPA